MPIKIWAPEITLTLIESNQKKATFLREVTRALTLTNINVFSGRAEHYPTPGVDVVTLRAVERFESILPIATNLVAPKGRLALLISKAQLATAQESDRNFHMEITHTHSPKLKPHPRDRNSRTIKNPSNLATARNQNSNSGIMPRKIGLINLNKCD